MEPLSRANTLDVLKAMGDLELSLAEFYRFCSGVREGEKDFWLALAEDEDKHSRKIEEMAQRIGDGRSLLVPNASFNAAPVHNLKNFIAKSMRRLRNSQIPTDFKTLVSIAWNIEYSILEIKYSDLFSIAEQGYEELMQPILSDTASHRGKLGSRITAFRSSRARPSNRPSTSKKKSVPQGHPLKSDQPFYSENPQLLSSNPPSKKENHRPHRAAEPQPKIQTPDIRPQTPDQKRTTEDTES